ncbi:hypothetical protein [Streptomyces sp. VRA16 Mangrove soil]|uniref:hypothetical protein n=1 Tax=Streptomyces sp. VRA16 Mangrove soil TaxID=2817434 RepID=UPI001A9EC897|nr:hypothetical protein [Streptomyces sp. VRA16 Mangrove soil]MBO1333367.1 hypothetical protein [Streptomyces sp. VRA16 Mangrove soil]
MAEQERREPESPEPEEQQGGQSRDPFLPPDEDAAWAAIVAGYGAEPPDPPGAKPFKSVEDLALPPEVNEPPDAASPRERTEEGPGDREREDGEKGGEEGKEGGPRGPLGSSISFAPGVAATPGPRDYTTPEPSDDDLGDDDEGHFVQPDPPLPEADVTAKFAWLAVVGGPVLLLLTVLLGWDMTWWLATLCIGGFLGGFATLVARMQPGDDEDDDPGRGAVV